MIQVPNWRPPSPHSSICASVLGRRQHAATKPITVTRAKKKMKTASADQSMVSADHAPSPRAVLRHTIQVMSDVIGTQAS